MATSPRQASRLDDTQHGLEKTQMATNPFDQLQTWLEAAYDAGVTEPNAMCLATVGGDAQPAARIVLLREIRVETLCFYTNYNSRKGRELSTNANAAAVFFWAPLKRQVRVEGRVERLAEAVSDAYFQKRPYESRLGAWASQQSEPIAGRHILETRMAELRKRYDSDDVPRPPHWGGYGLKPKCFEFWQGRAFRLNDRMLYQKTDQGHWSLLRLSP